MATYVQARQLVAADREPLEDESEDMGTSCNRPATPYAGRIPYATPGQYAKVPPAIHPASLLARPGMGRQMSSVSNLIDAYTRNSPSASRNASEAGNSNRNSTSNSISAPNSPSAARMSHSPHSLYYSQIITRRSSMQVSGSPRTSTSELSPLVRDRRPSAPEIHSPPARVMPGAHGASAHATATASSNMGTLIDMKRLRSKPAPPQQAQTHQQSSNSMLEHRHDTSSSTVFARSGDQQPTTKPQTAATLPKEQHDSITPALPTMLSATQLSSQASPAMPQSLADHGSNNGFARPSHTDYQVGPSSRAEQRQGQQQASNTYINTSEDPSEGSSRSHYAHSESSSSDNHRHVDSSSLLQQYYPAGRSRFDSSTSNSDSGTSQQHTYNSTPRPASPHTPRKIRNSSLPMGTSPSLSSSPGAGGRHSPSSRYPLKPIAPANSSATYSPYHQSYPVLPNQAAMPAVPRAKTTSDREMYESILPTSSTLRPHGHVFSEGFYITSPPSSSSEVMTSPEQAVPSTIGSPTKSGKERELATANSPVAHKKLIRKQSRGHMRKDSGTSGHAHPSSSNAHSRSLSLPRTASRGSTPSGGTGSGSGSEQDDLTSTNSSHSHFLTRRPAWLDQDPNATFPPLPQPNSASRTKPPQQHTLLLQQHNDRRPLHQSHPDTSLDQPSLASTSLPSTSALLASQVEAATTAPAKRKGSFYRRKRSQTATGDPITDSNGFPMPSPMSEIVKNMPLHDRMSHDALQPPAPPPKRSTSAGGFLSSITRKLSHPNIKDPQPNFEIVPVDASPDYSGAALPSAATSDKPNTQSQPHNINNHSSPKLGSSFGPRSWLHPFQNNSDHAKNDTKALPQLPHTSATTCGKTIYGDPFSASSTISLPGFLHRSPRKDSLSSDKSEQSNGLRRRGSRSRKISQDGDSSDGHSSELGVSSLRGYDLAPPVPELPFGMRNAAGSPPSASTLPKASRKTPSILRSPSLGHRSKKTIPDLELSPATPRAAVSNYGGTMDDDLPSPTRAGMLVITKANESLHSARRSGLSAALAGANGTLETAAPSILGSFAAMDKIAAIENDIKEARFMALMDRSARAEQGVIKLSVASSAAREAGIA